MRQRKYLYIKKKCLTMAERGEPYMIMLRPELMSPITSILCSPSINRFVANRIAPKNPTFIIPTRIPVFTYTDKSTHFPN